MMNMPFGHLQSTVSIILLKPIDNIRLEEAIVKFEHLTTKYLNQGQKPIDLMEILQNKSIFNDERNYFYEIKKCTGLPGNHR